MNKTFKIKTKIVSYVGTRNLHQFHYRTNVRKRLDGGAESIWVMATMRPMRQLSKRLNAAKPCTKRPLAILQDLSGPKIRIGNFTNEEVTLIDAGCKLTLTTETCASTVERGVYETIITSRSWSRYEYLPERREAEIGGG